MAMINKGIRLGDVGRAEDALAAYDAVVAKFGDAPELALRKEVATAMLNKGAVLTSYTESRTRWQRTMRSSRSSGTRPSLPCANRLRWRWSIRRTILAS